MRTSSPSYASEIRDWLFGRIAKRRDVGAIRTTRHDASRGRAVLWWILEGKQYGPLGGALARSWRLVEHQARRTLQSYNPTSRVVDHCEGEVDWLASAVASTTASAPRFVTRASIVALTSEERDALLAWLAWVPARWREYATEVRDDEHTIPPTPRVDVLRMDERRIRWCAHVARRSRWPLLRSVVAESLRPIFEPHEVDRLPLPTEPAHLFELVCMVRILRALEPAPGHIRWLGRKDDGNDVRMRGLVYSSQHRLAHADVLGGGEFDHGLREAVERHDLGVPSRADGWLRFDRPRAGFDGILIEAKSGEQSPEAAIYQLKCYRSALRRQGVGRMLVWGIAERETEPRTRGGCAAALSSRSGTASDDLWLFSTVDEIGDVVRAVLGASEDSPSRYGNATRVAST